MHRALSVRQFNEYIKTSFRHDPILSRVYITGELANIKYSHSHLYFSLKEGSDIIDCVIYYHEDKEIDFNFSDGIEVNVKGTLNFNNYSSRLLVSVSDIEEKGLSETYLEFLKMKEDFRKKGYFDEINKKAIPNFPKNIGLITSKDGAAVIDFLAVINQIPNDIRIKLYPVKVQGNQSVGLIVNAIERLDKENLDTIVISRGGGASEDLATFNDRQLIEVVFKANTPIISAIGHKIDTTLLDLVADLSLQTPTEAGSYIVRNYSNIEEEMGKILQKMKDLILAEIRIKELRTEGIGKTISLYNPKNIVGQKEKDIKSLYKDIRQAMDASLSSQETRLNILDTRLRLAKNLIDARKENIRIRDKNSREIYSKHSLKSGDIIEVNFSDGSIKAEVIDG